MLYSVIDVETTGGSASTTKITEIAIYVFDGTRIVDSFVSLINPEKHIPSFISNLTGITNDMVLNAPKFFEIAKSVVKLTENTIFVAHNVGFDYNVIRGEFRAIGYDYRLPHLCTVKTARKILIGEPSYSLGKLCKSLNIELKGHHRASNDALATVELLKKMIAEINVAKLEEFIETEINPRELHPLLDISIIDNLPNTTGIYRFFDEFNRLIYIGKSINIRTRILQHLKNNKTKRSIQMKQEIAKVTFNVTGSELIALLSESEEIKKFKPKFNRALRKNKFNFGVYDILDQKGYLNLTLENVNKTSAIPLATFTTKDEGIRYLNYICEKYNLCQKLLGLYPGNDSCFQFQIKSCKGACIGIENKKSYNNRLQKYIDSLEFENKDFILIEKGRTKKEKSIIEVKNGHFVGFGFIPIYAMKSDYHIWQQHIKIRKEDKDARMILSSYLKRNNEGNQLQFRFKQPSLF